MELAMGLLVEGVGRVPRILGQAARAGVWAISAHIEPATCASASRCV